ncbi:MAG TPA: HIT family protein [Bacteroidaceae bacterium]|jgi:histidine triad (HIT) family protein|nr:HIT family protein [Bacteroidales bacterium]OPZ49441.1 MAG: HIT-like protein [Bacteroidetes bacterium ADurb.BinA104]HBA13089.1 HIT family protein [Bacteroidales bacterium]HPX98894.1 HIT family protein [Bacteroidaceae bacterium]
MTIFSKIIKGDIPCYKIAETENCFAFLDINPLVRGHVLCISKREVDYLFDLTDRELCDLQLFAKKIAIAQKKVFGCIKVGQAVLGLEVPHAHIHLIPLHSEKDMLFSNPKLKLTDDEFRKIASDICAAL